MPISNERIVWIDCEMTGLDTKNDALIEVAALVTDSELNILGDGVDVVIKPDDAALAQMNDFVRDMHTRSGLLEELPHGKTMAEAQEMVLAYIKKWVPDPKKAPLGGNSVGTDRVFLVRDMPDLVEHLHYRVIDVSTIKELSRRWYARAYFQSPAKLGGHRALGDIKDSIDELRYYRQAVFVPAPGPDSSTAQRIAKDVMATSGAAPGSAPTDAADDAGNPGGAPAESPAGARAE
ncbi:MULTISPECIES: oligoribonuclease [unclassified Arthrobacter]|uniref:oligoribonuclease n=1 Tax=unclassified Arthrobacter TaxID=235627 RepID=UPI00343020B4